MDLKIWLILFFPILGVVINAFFGSRLPKRVSGAIACVAVGLSFLWSVRVFSALAAQPPDARLVTEHLWTWIKAGNLVVGAELLLDPLSAVMILVVTGVGFLIHVYSTGYMARDEGYARYFTYLNLFMFSMLVLVLGANFLMLFVGWEGVGLCSYLLIGFWYKKKTAADAGKKAFIVNRVGDFGFLLGVLLVLVTFGTLDFIEVFDLAPHVLAFGGATATWITMLLFVGAVGKSAQLPLYVWLPDAMEGPTPVSALIHAATMVTAGVYMVARCHVLFNLSPASMAVVGIVGALTAAYAASIGMVQHDIKRVLAYSTISQIGYMFLGCGVGAYAAGIFHLMTHAFFKALLFLGAGSVIHALANEMDMRRMGGLWRKLPLTGWVMLVGTLAIAGIIPFSGFFSKDEILWKTFSTSEGLAHFWRGGGALLWVVGILTAMCTGFYMGRLFFKTFFGKSRVSPDVAERIHEAPPSMAVPLVLLAVLAVIGGWIGLPHVFAAANVFEAFLEPVFTDGLEASGIAYVVPEAHGNQGGAGLEVGLMVLSVGLAVVGLAVAGYMYYKREHVGTQIAARAPGLYRRVLGKYHVDEVYEAIFVRGGGALCDFLWRTFDNYVIDGAVNGTAWVAGISAEVMRWFQTGSVRYYAMVFLTGAVMVLLYCVTR